MGKEKKKEHYINGYIVGSRNMEKLVLVDDEVMKKINEIGVGKIGIDIVFRCKDIIIYNGLVFHNELMKDRDLSIIDGDESDVSIEVMSEKVEVRKPGDLRNLMLISALTNISGETVFFVSEIDGDCTILKYDLDQTLSHDSPTERLVSALGKDGELIDIGLTVDSIFGESCYAVSRNIEMEVGEDVIT